MASRRLSSFTISLLACLLLLLLLITITCSSSSSSNDKVTVSLYYETLCPYCGDFIVNHLVKLFDRGGLISIVNLRLIPWGNAFISEDGSFVCQHGPNECFLNTIEACAIATYPDVSEHFRFVHCVERLVLENRYNEWGTCLASSRMSKAPVDCYTSGNGRTLEQRYAAETAQLNPPHRFVPWLVVNNQPLLEDFGNFASHICKAYRGSRVPEACRSLPAETNSLREESTVNKVCYKFSNLTSLNPALNAPTSIHA